MNGDDTSYAWLVTSSGSCLVSYYDGGYVGSSYGSPDTNYGNFAGLVDQSSGVYDSNVDFNSYWCIYYSAGFIHVL